MTAVTPSLPSIRLPVPAPRVAFVDHCAVLSGGEIALVRLLEALAPIDARVILGEDGPLAPRLRAAGAQVEILALPSSTGGVARERVTVRRLPVGAALGALRYVLALARVLRRLRPDLVHTNSLKAGLYGSLAARLAGVPCVWHVRDRIAEDYLPAQAVRLVRAAVRILPQAVIVNSEATLRTLDRRGARSRARVVHDPYRPARPAPTPSERGSFTVGMVGRLAPWKGQDLFLEAFARVAAAVPEARAVLVGAALFGEDEYERRVLARCHEPDLLGRVEVRGFRPDIEAELARLDVLVHASTIPEPFGQVIVEGLAAGLPVVAPDAGGAAEIVRHEDSGLLYRLGDAGALAAALLRLHADPGLMARLRGGATRRAADFAPETIAAQVRSVYAGLVGGRGAGAGRAE